MWRHHAKAHSHIQDQDRCTSFLVMQAALTDSEALLSATSPTDKWKSSGGSMLKCWKDRYQRQKSLCICYYEMHGNTDRYMEELVLKAWPVRVLDERGQTLLSSLRLQQVLLCVGDPKSSLFALSSMYK